MKINEVTLPTQNPRLLDKLKTIEDFINKNCRPYLKEIGFDPERNKLYRGLTAKIGKKRRESSFRSAMIITPRTDRAPRDTDIKVHQIAIDGFNKTGFVANRNNSIFCTSSFEDAKGFGSSLGEILSTYVVYPIGTFDFTWSPEVDDFTVTHGSENEYFYNGVYSLLNLDKALVPDKKLIGILQIIRYFDDNKTVDWFDIMNKFLAMDGNKKMLDDKKITLDYLFKTNPSHSYKQSVEYLTQYYGNIERIKEDFPMIELDEPDTSSITNQYQSTDLMSAISSKHEVMLRADKVLLVRYDYDKYLWQNDIEQTSKISSGKRSFWDED